MQSAIGTFIFIPAIATHLQRNYLKGLFSDAMSSLDSFSHIMLNQF